MIITLHKSYVAAFSLLLNRSGENVLSDMALKFPHSHIAPRWTFILFLQKPLWTFNAFLVEHKSLSVFFLSLLEYQTTLITQHHTISQPIPTALHHTISATRRSSAFQDERLQPSTLDPHEDDPKNACNYHPSFHPSHSFTNTLLSIKASRVRPPTRSGSPYNTVRRRFRWGTSIDRSQRRLPPCHVLLLQVLFRFRGR